MKGRKPKPTYLRVLEGNREHRPLNADEPIPTGEIGDPPEWMSAKQQKLWRETVKQAPEGLLKDVDASVLTGWVIARDTHEVCSVMVTRYGPVIRSPGTGVPMQSPYVPILTKMTELMTRCAAEMGFSPSSRSRVKVQRSKSKSGIFAELKELD